MRFESGHAPKKPLLVKASIHYCTVPNSTGRYAESGKFFKQEKTKAIRFALELNGGERAREKLLMAWLERKTEVLISELLPQVFTLAYALLDKGSHPVARSARLSDAQSNCNLTEARQ